MTQPATPQRAAPRRRWWRWPLRITVGLVALLLIILVAGAIVLRSDIPRRLAEDAARKRTGLRITIDRVDVGIFGKTTARGIVVREPLDHEPLVQLAELAVRHASIPMILLTGDPGLADVRATGLAVRATERQPGEWNIADAIERARLVAGSSAGSNSGAAPQLPAISIVDATITATPIAGPALTVPLTMQGSPADEVVWQFTIDLGRIGTASGRLAAGGNWAHSVSFDADLEPAVLSALGAADLDHARARGRWDGSIAAGSLSGLLTLESAQAAGASASGAIAVRAGDGQLRVEPRDLALIGVPGIDAPAIVGRGAATLARDDLRLESLDVRWPDHHASLDAAWNLATRRGSASASWSGTSKHGAHDGQLDATLALRHDGRVEARASIRSTGAPAAAHWNAAGTIDAAGPSWNNLTIDLRFPTLTWTDQDGTIHADGSAARLVRDGSSLRLHSLSQPLVPGAVVRGEYDLDAGTWTLDAAAHDWTAPIPAPAPIDVALRARGSIQAVTDATIDATAEGLAFTARGGYDPKSTTPLQATGRLTRSLPPTLDDIGQPDAPAALHGEFDLAFAIGGTLRPLALDWRGTVTTLDASAGGLHVGSLSLDASGSLADDHAVLTHSPMDLFGGRVTLTARARSDGRTAGTLELSGIDLDSLAQAASLGSDLRGRADAAISFSIVDLDARTLTASARIDAAHVVAGPVAFDHAVADLRATADGISVVSLVAQRGEGHATARGSARFETGTPALLTLELNRWPVDLSGDDVPIALRRLAHAATIDGRLDLDASIDDRAGTGHASLVVSGRSPDGDESRLTLGASLDHRTIDATRIDLVVRENSDSPGRFTGTAAASLDDLWTTARADIAWSGLQLGPLAAILGAPDDIAADLHGLAGGALTLEPTPGPRALGPLALKIDAAIDDGRFRELPLRSLSLDATLGPRRSTLERSRLELAGGSVDLYAATDLHGGDRYVQVRAILEDLNLDPIARTIDPAADPTPGLLRGVAIVAGYTDTPHRLFGEARLGLHDASLIAVGPVRTIFDSLGRGESKPDGVGMADFRLEGNALELSRFTYTQGGVDLYAAATLDDVTLGADTPIAAVAAGTIRPFRSIALARDLDRLFSAFQRDAVTVRLSGTLRDRTVTVVPFSDVGGTVKRLITGRE